MRHIRVGSALILLLRGYQRFISPFLPPSCRFYPSCSQYAVGAIRRHGALYGLWLTLLRLSKCHPFHPGGYDPVPDPSRPEPLTSLAGRGAR